MESVLRAGAIYLFLFVVFRIAGRRPLAEMTAFDMVLLLVIGEAISEALNGADPSFTHAAILVATLVLMELGFAWIKQRSPVAERLVDDVPLVVVEHGKPLKERMERVHVDESDILEAARALHGLENMQQVKYAVLERDGAISVIPESSK
jgi:uncharacterized membrane protein YcaP (DUF421 family)